MAHYVAQTLSMRPAEILDTWSVAELIVAYGVYKNEETYRNFLEWQQLSIEAKRRMKEPKAYGVLFYSAAEVKEMIEAEKKGGG